MSRKPPFMFGIWIVETGGGEAPFTKPRRSTPERKDSNWRFQWM